MLNNAAAASGSATEPANPAALTTPVLSALPTSQPQPAGGLTLPGQSQPSPQLISQQGGTSAAYSQMFQQMLANHQQQQHLQQQTQQLQQQSQQPPQQQQSGMQHLF